MGICCCVHDDAVVYKPTETLIEIEPEETIIPRVPVFPSAHFLCSICLDETDMSEIESTVCGHVFHRRCLRDWWTRRYSCPMCNMDIKKFLRAHS